MSNKSDPILVGHRIYDMIITSGNFSRQLYTLDILMHSIEHIEQSLYAHIATLFPEIKIAATAIALTVNDDPKRQQFGDASTNVALTLSKIVPQQPRIIAGTIIATFNHPAIEACSVAGAGFINLTFTPAAFAAIAHDLHTRKDAFFTLSNEQTKTHYSVEFVSANPTGPLHLGHGRGGIIGDVYGNIVRFLGHTVTKEFYVNDAGKQIATLGASFKIRCQQQLGETVELPEDGYHGDYLVTLAQTCVTENKDKVVVAIADNNTNFFAQYAKEYLQQKIKETLSAYGITFDVWFSEKTLHDSGAITAAIEKLLVNGCAYADAEGAVWLASTNFGDDKDRVLRKTNGELTYAGADLAYLENKITRGAQKLVCVLGQDHHSYVIRLKSMLQSLGYSGDMLDVILYQLVTIKEEGVAVRLSKRAGRIVSLEDIIEIVGKDVARFFYLHRKADAHLNFDVALALRKTEENPVYYIQYAYVRTHSIMEKSQEFPALLAPVDLLTMHFDDAEKLLIKKIVTLKTLLREIAGNYQVHLLTYYVIELANQFHSFYAAHKVIDPENVEQSQRRLLIIKMLHDTFALCFTLIGVDAPQRM